MNEALWPLLCCKEEDWVRLAVNCTMQLVNPDCAEQNKASLCKSSLVFIYLPVLTNYFFQRRTLVSKSLKPHKGNTFLFLLDMLHFDFIQKYRYQPSTPDGLWTRARLCCSSVCSDSPVQCCLIAMPQGNTVKKLTAHRKTPGCLLCCHWRTFYMQLWVCFYLTGLFISVVKLFLAFCVCDKLHNLSVALNERPQSQNFRRWLSLFWKCTVIETIFTHHFSRHLSIRFLTAHFVSHAEWLGNL